MPRHKAHRVSTRIRRPKRHLCLDRKAHLLPPPTPRPEPYSTTKTAHRSRTPNAHQASSSTGRSASQKKIHICPQGQKLNTERKEYELEGGPKCPAGQTYNGEHCILASTDCLEYEFCPAQSPALPKPPSALGMTANPSLSADSLKKRQPSRSVMEPVSGPKLVLSRASDFWKT